ncbi:MAG: hypothetical protein DME69_00360 [Verrucomicrobia bacterium]|nr:MAG: hypothetical protein DME69_00360 [Verrucomicrobiota bacterium]
MNPAAVKDFLIPALTFVLGGLGGLFGGLWPHVQKPLTEYRQTLTDISQLMLRSVAIIYGDEYSERERFYDDIRELHARLMSSADSIPRPARPVLQVIGLLRPRDQIEEGAKMLIGISNQVIGVHRDDSHLVELTKKLGAALDITV